MKGHIEKRTKGTWTVVIDQGRNPISKKRDRIYKSVSGPKREAEKLMQNLDVRIQELLVCTGIDKALLFMVFQALLRYVYKFSFMLENVINFGDHGHLS